MTGVPNIFALGQDAYKDAYSTQDQITKDRTKIAAGRQLATGDYTGAASTLNANGQIEDAHNVVADQQVLQDRQQIAKGRLSDQAAKVRDAQLMGLLKLTDAISAVPEGKRQAWLQQNLPVIQSLGLPVEQFAQMDESHLTDAALAPWKAGLDKAKEDYNIGGVRYAGGTNKPIAGFAEFDPHKTIYAVGDQPAGAPGGPTTSTTGETVPPPPAPPANGGADPQMVWKSIKQQESGGAKSPGTAVGPDTSYGNALGSTQMLPKTAQGMAAKLGVPFRPDLLQSNAPEALAYQDQLGQAYFQEGLQKYGGDVQKAAMYYYGGPDEKLWGPKTHAYAQQVLARAGQAGQDVVQGGAGPDTIPPPAQIAGFHVVSQAKPEWQDMADGRQRNVITGKVEGQPTAEDDAPLSPEAVKLLAGKYLNNGTLPPMGMGKTGTRNRVLVLNEATTQARALGLDANDLVAGTVTGKAAAQALNKATGIRSLVEASERTVLQNAQYALGLANQGGSGPSHIPVLNRWIQAGRKDIAGDAQVAQFNQAIKTVAEEYAKVMTTTTGTGGQSSDSARNEAYNRLDAAMTNEQLKAVIDSMRVEMDNRAASLRDTEAGLRNVIRSGGQPGGLGSPPEATPAAAPKVRRYNPATGRLE